MDMDPAKHRLPHAPKDVGPLDPDTFTEAVLRALENAPTIDPEDDPVLPLPIERPDGTVSAEALSSRVFLGLLAYYGDHHTHAMWASARFVALQAHFTDPRMEPWISESHLEGKIAVNGAVFEAAATLPLAPRWCFDAETLFARIAELTTAEETRLDLED